MRLYPRIPFALAMGVCQTKYRAKPMIAIVRILAKTHPIII